MIFNDQETAQEFRAEAEIQLIEFITGLVKQVNVNSEFADADLKEFVKMEYRQNLPAIVNTLLNKSGMVYPADSQGVYPVNLYYDNDDKNEYIIGQAIYNSKGLTGGICNGRIHT